MVNMWGAWSCVGWVVFACCEKGGVGSVRKNGNGDDGDWLMATRNVQIEVDREPWKEGDKRLLAGLLREEWRERARESRYQRKTQEPR